jgi:D-sedoheptulose 7-phosphate isomerase
MIDLIRSELQAAQTSLNAFLNDDLAIAGVEQAASLLINVLQNGNKVITAGNGGSMCDAMHFAEELSGRYRSDRPALAALALSDPGFLTCAANDFGFENVFKRGIEALSRPGDAVVLFSTSGSSPNIVAAAKTARALDLQIIGLTGKQNADLAQFCDVTIVAPSSAYADRIQEIHIKVVHILIACVERQIFKL